MFNNAKKTKNNAEKKRWNEKTSSYSFMLHKIRPQASHKPLDTEVTSKSVNNNIRPEITGQEQEHHNSNAPRSYSRKIKSK